MSKCPSKQGKLHLIYKKRQVIFLYYIKKLYLCAIFAAMQEFNACALTPTRLVSTANRE